MNAAALGLKIPRVEIFTLRELALEVAIQEAERKVTEREPNWHPRLHDYWLNLEPPVDIRALKQKPPWCAVFVQYCYDAAARLLQTRNPLDDVLQEAYVQSYYELAKKRGWIVGAEEAEEGDLVLYSFGGKRYDHIGILRVAPGEGPVFWVIEGNTPPQDIGDQRGASTAAVDGVYPKRRRIHLGKPVFVRPTLLRAGSTLERR